MKKLIGVLVVLILGSNIGFADPGVGTEPPNAGWNFGNVTYGQEGGSLILNSLSDNYGISQFNTTNTNGQATQVLGSNDYIQESAVTNMLAIEGYSNAYTYDPQYTGLYASAYNQPLPTNVPLTELSFLGLAGNPNAIENIYVPTAQYNELSVQGVNGMLDPNTTLNQTVNGNTTAISNETVRAQGAEANLQSQVSTNAGNITTLQNGLATTNTNVTNLTNTVNTNTTNIAANTAGINAINNMTNPNTVLDKAVNGNTVAIANETNRAITAENVLTSNLNVTNAQVNTNTKSINTLNTGLTATNSSLAGTQNMTDNSVITNTVKNNTANIATLGTGLAQTNAVVNTNTQNISALGAGLNATDAQVNNNTANIGALNTGLNNETARAQAAEAGLQNQINQDEKVKVMADLNLRILDTKKYTVGFFDMYDGTNQRNFAFGARLTYKLGKSYEEKTLEAQKKQLDNQAAELLELRAMVHNLVQKGQK